MLGIQYQPRIVAFLDILGFKSFLRDESRLGELVSAIQIFQSTFLYNRGFFRKEISVTHFSDSFMIHSEVSEFGDLISILALLSFALASLACSGVSVRGAVSYGSHFQTKDILVSPAFARAYELETSIAKYPRVVLGAEVVELFLRSSGNEGQLNLVTQLDVDGYRFVNYLEAFRFLGSANERIGNEFKFPPELPLLTTENYLRKHKEIIEGKLKCYTDSSVLSKQIWLGNYHNEFVTTYFGLARPDLRIPGFLLSIRS